MLESEEVALEDASIQKASSTIVWSKSSDSSNLALHSPQEDASTAAPSCSDTASETSEIDRKSEIEAIRWRGVKYGKRIHPVCDHAHCADDIYLLSAYLELARLPDIDSDLAKLVLRALTLLRLCNYSIEDICSILAHASVYFEDMYSQCGSRMHSSEVANVLVMVMFVANSYVQDETAQLHVWHQQLFQNYCSLKALNDAIIGLLKVRGFALRLESEDLSQRHAFLLRSTRRTKMERQAANEEFSCITLKRVVAALCAALPHTQEI